MLVHELENVTPKELIARYFRKKCIKYQPKINFFLKPNDAISELPLRGVGHDRDVVEAIKFLSKYFPDIFVDVGANIGLVSMAVSDTFKKTICIEPNPLVFNILKTNAMLNMSNFDLYEIGLATESKKIKLHIPKVNLGGAFILDENLYSKSELARKDGYKEFDLNNYIEQEVDIKSCSVFFENLKHEVSKSILIKIDVEGLDFLLLNEILRIFDVHWRTGKIGIIFESHNIESVRKVMTVVEKFGYTVFNIEIRRLNEIRFPLLRRIYKLFKGERSMLVFNDNLVTVDSQFTNFACIPKRCLQN